MKGILKSWMSKRHALQPIPMGNLQGQLSAMASAREDAESDGLYSAAQRNAQKELKKRHRYEPVRKSSRTPVLTPRMLRNSAESKKCKRKYQYMKSENINLPETKRQALRQTIFLKGLTFDLFRIYFYKRALLFDGVLGGL
jgi:hypothetical protein